MRNQPKLLGIYSLIHIPTGRRYIGSSNDVYRRRYNYKYYDKLPYAYRKDNLLLEDLEFELVAIYVGITKEELLSRELYWINRFSTVYPDGFNLQDPTTVCSPLPGVRNYRWKTRVKIPKAKLPQPIVIVKSQAKSTKKKAPYTGFTPIRADTVVMPKRIAWDWPKSKKMDNILNKWLD